MSLVREQIFILSDPTTRTVFDRVAQRRSTRLRDLVQDVNRSLPEASENDIAVKVEKVLERLKAAGLIAEKKSALPSLNRYYITADGLQAERAL